MTWPDELAQQLIDDARRLGELIPDEVLYEFEGPCIFTTRAPSGGLLLAYLVEEIENAQLLRFLVATTTPVMIKDLKSGLVAVRDALTQGWLWVADVNFNYVPQRLYTVSQEQLPDYALPADGTMLWAHLEPALKVKLIGEDIHKGSIPALVFSQAGEIAAKSLKSVFEFIVKPRLSEISGRPPEWLRNLYNLPTQRVAYGSLEINFRAPELPDFSQQELPFYSQEMQPDLKELIDKGWNLLERGLEWAARSDEQELEMSSDDERVAILEALRRLAPNSTGPVHKIEVSGSKVNRTTYCLTRSAAKKIRRNLALLKRQKDVQLKIFQGRIRDLDLDKLALILRDMPDEKPAEVAFALEDEQLLEMAREAHYQEAEVRVAGRSVDGKNWTIVEIEFVSSAEMT